MNSKIGHVDLCKNENGWVCLKEYWFSRFHVYSYDVIFKQVLKIASSLPKYNFCDEISKIYTLFIYIHIRPNLWSNFGNHTCLERFKKILCISSFGLRGGGVEIMTMIGVQNCQFLAKSENWTNAYALSLIHIWRCRRYAVCRSRWSPYH